MPLTTDGVTVGAMVVANRLTEVSSFVEDDLRLFETLANHANVALANGRLVATLQHDAQEKAYQALHDPVTGLPNRTMLQERLETAISEARDERAGRGPGVRRPGDLQGGQRHARHRHRRPAPRGGPGPHRGAAARAGPARPVHRRPVRRARHRRDRPGRGARARRDRCWPSSSRRSPPATCRSCWAPTSASRCTPTTPPPPSCSCSEPTPPPTGPARRARASRSTPPRPTRTRPAAWRSPPTCRRPSSATRSTSTCSRRCR